MFVFFLILLFRYLSDNSLLKAGEQSGNLTEITASKSPIYMTEDARASGPLVRIQLVCVCLQQHTNHTNSHTNTHTHNDARKEDEEEQDSPSGGASGLSCFSAGAPVSLRRAPGSDASLKLTELCVG